MVNQFLKKRSKRVPARRRFKIEKKVREHNRKLRRAARKNPTKNKPKIIPVPNMCPFKEDVLQEAEELKKKKEDERAKRREEIKELRKQKRTDQQNENRGLEGLVQQAQVREKIYNNFSDPKEQIQQERVDSSSKAYYKEFKKVLEAADVVLEIVDARDPLGTRCRQVEQTVLDAGASKRLVLVLNKADLVPQDNLEKWLKYLRQSFPAVAFKASTQRQTRRLCRRRGGFRKKPKKFVSGSPCVGADLLMSLLANYCRNKGIKTSIRVGVVGLPNVGKSSIINSLKRSRACNVGAVPGVTRSMQEVQLDSKIKLLDSPGIVFASGKITDASVALKNAKKPESLQDPITPVMAILQRASKEQMMLLYNIGDYSSPQDFLSLKAKKMGRLKKGGIPDIKAAAYRLIQDWNKGKIKYYTIPPEESQETHISATIVKEIAAEFDIEKFGAMETDIFNALPNVMQTDTMLMESSGLVEASSVDEEVMDLDENDTNAKRNGEIDLLSEKVTVEVEKERNKGKSKEVPAGKKSEPPVVLEGNKRLNKLKKVQLKKLKKMRARREKEASALADVLEDISLANNEDYDFKVDFNLT